MVNYEKIGLMFENIKEVGVSFFSEISLAKLLETLNEQELIEFFKQVPEQFKDSPNERIHLMALESIVREQIELDYIKVCKSSYYKKFLEDLKNINELGRIDIDLSKYEKMELGNLQFAINHSINFDDEISINASKKIISLIKDEIKEREKKNKPTFENQGI